MPQLSRAVWPALFYASLLGQAPAQEAGAAGASEPAYFEVTGVADNDLLNIRATASAAGMVIGRLMNGARVKNLGCSEVKGNRWCKIEDMLDRKVAGWTPARYLIETSADSAEAMATDPLPAESTAEEEVAATEPETAAASSETGFDATAAIPCARTFGQPMTLCQAGAVRGDEGEAVISVTWPNGGERIIRFRGGKPDSSNSEEALRFTREADLNMIRIGKGERFEIPDALPFGG